MFRTMSFVKSLGCLVFFLVFMELRIPQGIAQSSLAQEINSQVDQEYENLFQLYRHLHANPELSFQEAKTAERIQKELESAGFQVTTGIGGFGLVGVLKNGDGPVLMIRTDLDGLPVTEQTGLEYASRIKIRTEQGTEVGVMHACGHDIHMTSFIGTARLMSQFREHWRGTLLMIGQPAEERGGGAKAMLGDGLFQKFPRPDHVLAMHDNSNLETGKVAVVEGNALAGVDSVDLTIRGVSGHGAYPQATKDPIVLSAQIVLALQTIVSREIPPIEPAVLTVGSIHGGTKHNIIPDEVRLQITVRYYSDSVRATILEGIERISKNLALAAGVPQDRLPVMKVSESIPPTINDSQLAHRIQIVMESVLGKENVANQGPVMGGEDFGFFGRTTDKIPICIFWLGAVNRSRYQEAQKPGSPPLPSLHSSLFAPDPQPTIKTGVKAMTAAALALLEKRKAEGGKQ
jgi:amidohydrolase